MKVVFDTNVIVAALLGKEAAASRQLIEMALNGTLTPIMGDTLFNEYLDVVNRTELMDKCPLDQQERMELLADFFSCCQWSKVYFSWRPNLRDEGDNHLIELAIAGGANYLITNNLRDFNHGELRFDTLHIVTPQQFIQEA